jgi:hypothetical protein
MNRKQVSILVVLAVVLGGLGFWAMKNREQSWNESSAALGQKLFPDLPVNDITQIHIKGSGELNLVKKDDTWRVEERGGYPANYSEISDFILKAADLKISQSEPIGASQIARMELEEPGKGSNSATLLELRGPNGKQLQSVLLGKKHVAKSDRPNPYGMGDMPDGRYVMRKDDTKNLLLIREPLTQIEPTADHWLNKDFFKVEKAKTIALNSTNAASSWKLTRDSESAPWKLADVKTGEVLDTNKVSSLGSTLGFPSFVDVSTNSGPDAGLDKPMTLVIETFDNFTYTIKLGKKTPENNFYTQVSVTANLPKERTAGKDEKAEDKAKLDKEFADKQKPLQEKLANEQKLDKWVYLVSSWTVDPLVRNRGELMEEKKEEKKDTASKTNSTVTATPPATKTAAK